MPDNNRDIVFFDFDHTLIKGESFWAFLGFAAGWPRTALAFAGSLALLTLRRLQKHPDAADHRTFIKDQLLRRLLAGRRVADLQAAARRLHGWRVWNEEARKALLDHHAAGRHIVIASGGLDLYLPELLREIPHHALICTNVGVKDGIVTGDMPDGNCVRARKAERVAEYLAAHGPFNESWGYGNLPHDLPMLELLKHRVVF